MTAQQERAGRGHRSARTRPILATSAPNFRRWSRSWDLRSQLARQVSLTGSDRVRWLNGMVTNNIRDLAPGHGVYAFLLNPQGHILGDLYAYNRGESLLVDTDQSQLEKILAVFDKYIIMDDVEVADISDRQASFGIAGPKSQRSAAGSWV